MSDGTKITTLTKRSENNFVNIPHVNITHTYLVHTYIYIYAYTVDYTPLLSTDNCIYSTTDASFTEF